MGGSMNIRDKMALVMRNSEELVTESELCTLLTKNDNPTVYIGFEPSGLVHIGWVPIAQKINDLINAGFKVIIFWADWHAYINDKLDGSLENIRICARYMQDCFIALGVPASMIEFRYASELVSKVEYWETVVKIAKVTSLSRVKRAMTIMGRSENEAEVDSSKMFYPILQVADIFCMKLDIAYAGIDQRKAHMLARDVAEKLGWKKPIALHTPLLPGLKGGNRMNPIGSKMSKSDPNNSISIHDSEDSISKKIKKAFCPTGEMYEAENPILMLCKYVLFPNDMEFFVNRAQEYGGPIKYSSYNELTRSYFEGSLSPMDLKLGVIEGLNKILRSVAEYFNNNKENYIAMIKILGEIEKHI